MSFSSRHRIISTLTVLLFGSAFITYAQAPPKGLAVAEEDQGEDVADRITQDIQRELERSYARVEERINEEYIQILEQASQQASQCRSAIDEAFPPVTIPLTSLDLTKAVIHSHHVSVPLKQPLGEIRGVRRRIKSLPQALSFLRFLHSWSIQAIRVKPYADLTPVKTIAGLEEVNRCANGEFGGSLKQILSPCAECPVFEFVGVQPDRGR